MVIFPSAKMVAPKIGANPNPTIYKVANEKSAMPITTEVPNFGNEKDKNFRSILISFKLIYFRVDNLRIYNYILFSI
jgi:hypothetical protein